MNEARVRIFVSSPADVDHERAIVKDVIERLAAEFLPYFVVEAVLWEDEALTADRTFQAGMVRPADCDIVLVVLWTRLGSPLPQDPYQGMTGTEWEFLNAIDAPGDRHRPEVLVYRKTNPRLVDINNPEATRRAIEDRERLEAFFQHHFFHEDRTFRRAFRTFDSDAAFRNLVEVQLRKLLNRRISGERRGTGRGWQGNPFRPEGPFDLGDEQVFTGREAETRDLLHRLQARMEEGRGLLLVSGPSGCGKTSLIRAGLLPRLVRPHQIEGVAGCRWCLVDPAAAATPLEALAQALSDPAVLGGILAGFGLDAPHLARTLSAEPATAASQVRAALEGLAGAVQQETGEAAAVRLVVAVDPLEAVRPADAGPLGRALTVLAAEGEAWVIALLRSDHLGLLPSLGPFADGLDDGGWMRLEHPAHARLRQVIEIPAMAAGLEYEGPPGRGPVERLEAEAAGLPHWAPLLEGSLDQLYQRRVQAPGRAAVLTVQALEETGGLAGEVLRRAERVWEGLDQEARAALSRLCRALVTLEPGVPARPVTRVGDLDVLEADPACARLVRALIEARLVVSEGTTDPVLTTPCPQPDYSLWAALGRLMRQSREEWRARVTLRRPSVAVSGPGEGGRDAADTGAEGERGPWRRTAVLAHPVLIERWAPMREWLADRNNRRLLVLRQQIAAQTRAWKRTDCNREHLLGEAGFAAAMAFARALPDELEPAEAELLAQSEAFLRYQRRGNRLARFTGVLLLALVLISTLAAFWAREASRTATVNLHKSRLAAADLAIARGNTPRAVALALDAAPHLPRQALETLSRAFTANRLIALAEPPGPDGLTPAFSPDGGWLATGVAGEGAQLWRLAERRYVEARDLGGADLDLHTLVYAGSEEGEPRILAIGPGGVWHLPAAPAAAPDWACGTRARAVTALSPAGQLALAHERPEGGHRVCLIDPDRPGEPVFDVEVHRRGIRSLAFSPDGARVLTASRDGLARVLDARTGALLLALPREGPIGRSITRAVFDAAGERIALAASDDRVRVYGRDGGLLHELAGAESGGRSFKVHSTTVRDVAFSPDGRYLIAGDDEGQVVRWDLALPGQAIVIGHHDLGVEQVRVSAGTERRHPAPLVLTASLDKSARLWDLDTGRALAVLSHDAEVSGASLGAGGQRIMTWSGTDGSGRLWSLDPVPRLSYPLSHDDHVVHLALADAPEALAPEQDLLLLATGTYGGRVRVFGYHKNGEGRPPVLLRELDGHQGRIRRVTFAPNGRWLASAAGDGAARVWDLVTGAEACVLAAAPPGEDVYRALFSPDADLVLTAARHSDEPLKLWDRASCTQNPPGDLALVRTPVQGAALAPRGGGGMVIAAGDAAGRVWVLSKGPGRPPKLTCDLALHGGAVPDIALSADGRWLASAGDDGRGAVVAIGEDGCGEPVWLDGHQGGLYSIAFSAWGGRLITAAQDATARVWERDGHLLAVLGDHRDQVYQAELDRRGDFAVTASRDGGVRVWKVPPAVPEGEPVLYLVLDPQLGGSPYAAFSPDGRYLAGAYWDDTAMFWHLWAEDEDSPLDIRAVWGQERARLAIVREAHRFLEENRLGPGLDDADGRR